MLRTMLKSKIHRATVTQADLHYVGSVTVDLDLMEAADLLAGEQVAIVDVTNGARLETYVIAGPRGSGVIGINGAAAHLVHPGDLVILISYGQLDDAAQRFERSARLNPSDHVGRRSLADPPSEDAPGGRANMDAHWATLDECLDDAARALDARAASEGRAVEESACSEAARPIVEDGTDTDRERLWSAFDALPDDSPLAGEVVDMFLERRVELSLAPFQGKTTSPAITPPDHAAPPALLQSAPDELQEAWRLYASVMQAPEKRPDTSSAEPVIAFQANEPAFRRAVVAFLRGRISPADIVREMSRFEWVGRCGTGSDVFYGPKVKVLVVAHLQLGRSDLALAAAKHGGFMGMDQTGLSADPRLLTAAGLDWERFHLGGVLSGHLDSSRPLALRGSNRAAGSLLTYARMLNGSGDEAPNPAFEWLLSTLAAFVEPGEGAEGLAARTDSRAARAADAEPIGGEVQQGVLELLATQFEPNASAWESTTAADVLVELARPESRPAFQAMLRSPYEGVRKQGAAGLRALGETVADPLPSRPVAFRLVVDGRPLRRADLSVLLETEGGGSDSSGAYTDDAGIVKQPFVAAGQRRTDALALRGLIPVRGRRDRAGMGGEPDEKGAGAVRLSCQLSEVDLALLAHLRRPRIAEVRVVRPHHGPRPAAGRPDVAQQCIEGFHHVGIAAVPGCLPAREHRPVVLLGVVHEPGVLLGEEIFVRGDPAVTVRVLRRSPAQFEQLLDHVVLARS